MLFNGIPVHSDPDCVSTKEFREVRRIWKERLFTRPWRPWRATRREGIPVAYALNVPALSPFASSNKQIVAHPEIVTQLVERYGK